MASLTLGIDIREVKAGAAGKGRYTEELCQSLILEAPENVNFKLFTQKKSPIFEGNPRVEQIEIAGKSVFWHLKLRKYLKKNPVDFFLAPTSFIYPALAPRNTRLAIVVHDLIAFLYPKHQAFARWVEKLTLNAAIKKSEFLICISESTKKDLLRLKKIASSKKIVMAPPAVSERFLKTPAISIDLPERYLLTVGTLQPRKNLKMALESFAEYSKKDSHLQLLVVGGAGWGEQDFMKNIAAKIQDRIHFLGHVQDGQLITLYQNALALLFPSFYEGFGLPPLEAMALGCPVVSSNRSSLPEVLGDAGVLADPEKLEEWTSGFEEILKNRETYIQKGLNQAKEFSWKRSAKNILDQLL